MPCIYVAITCIWIVLLASSPVLARTPSEIDAVVFDEMARQGIVGMAVGIVKNGKIYYAKGYGHDDLARKEPVTTGTVFRWGSISKTLTAAATLKLAEENPAFGLNDRVTEHVSYWPRYGKKGNIRIKHLLANRSGIIHYTNKKGCFENDSPNYHRDRHTSKYYNARQAVEVFIDQKLCFDPGTSYSYSTFGFSLLGSAIEGASGKSYPTWVKEKIKLPLGMSSLRQASETRKGFDIGYQGLNYVLEGNAAWKLPGGGWESNILDLTKFANALLQSSLLNKTSRLWTTVSGNRTYSYGINHAFNKSHVWHQGSQRNNRALMYLFPRSDDHLGIVLMTNSAHSNPMRIAYHLVDLF